MKIFTFLLLLFVYKHIQAQEIYNPVPCVKNDEIRLKKIEQVNTAQIVSYRDLPAQQKNFVKDAISSRTEYFKNCISNGDFLINSEIEKYCTQILDQILTSNPTLDKNIQLFVSRSEEPNAFNTGDGNIVLNIGLLEKLENDAQLTFIISHELAHQQMTHVNNTLMNKAAKYTDAKFRKALINASKEEYNTNAKLEALILPMIFGDRKFSRTDELEADSAGAVYMMNTGYSMDEITNILKMFKTIDKYHDHDPLELKKYFTDRNIETKDYWFKGNTKSSLGDFEEEIDTLEDSLKTHPDTDLRIAAINTSLKIKNGSSKIYTTNQNDFLHFRAHSTEELIFSNFVSGKLARAMYEAFILSRNEPGNDFSNVLLSLCFSRLHHLQKMYKVQLEVPLPNPKFFEKSYSNLIDFINQVRLNETLELSTKFLPQKSYDTSEIYLAAKAYNAFITKNSDFSNIKKNYLDNYPNGWFHKLLTNLTI